MCLLPGLSPSWGVDKSNFIGAVELIPWSSYPTAFLIEENLSPEYLKCQIMKSIKPQESS